MIRNVLLGVPSSPALFCSALAQAVDHQMVPLWHISPPLLRARPKRYKLRKTVEKVKQLSEEVVRSMTSTPFSAQSKMLSLDPKSTFLVSTRLVYICSDIMKVPFYDTARAIIISWARDKCCSPVNAFFFHLAPHVFHLTTFVS